MQLYAAFQMQYDFNQQAQQVIWVDAFYYFLILFIFYCTQKPIPLPAMHCSTRNYGYFVLPSIFTGVIFFFF